jgi:hypothetical protein
VLGVSMAQAAAFATAPSLELTGTPRACDWPHTRRGTRRIGALRASADAADEWTPLTDEASGNGKRSVQRERGDYYARPWAARANAAPALAVLC